MVKRIKDSLGLLFMLPAVVYLFVFVAYPILYNIMISFQDVNAFTLASPTRPFVGLDNFARVFSDKVTFLAIKNTFIFTIASIGFQFIFGFGLALLFARRFPLNQTYRGVLMIAWMVPMLIAATLGKWFFAGDHSGLVNYFAISLGLIEHPVSFLTSTGSAMAGLITMNIWKGIPFNMLLMATALTTMPEEIYEAASIDGASAVQRFTRITLPLLRPNILITITQGFIFTFKAFELIFVMTGGGPVNTTQILATYSYQLTFEQFNFGTGAATSNVLFLILMVIGILYLRLIASDEVMS